MILEDNNKVLGYIREYKGVKLVVLNNYYGENTEVELCSDIISGNSEILISNYNDSSELNAKVTLRPYESVAYIIK